MSDRLTEVLRALLPRKIADELAAHDDAEFIAAEIERHAAEGNLLPNVEPHVEDAVLEKAPHEERNDQ